MKAKILHFRIRSPFYKCRGTGGLRQRTFFYLCICIGVSVCVSVSDISVITWDSCGTVRCHIINIYESCQKCSLRKGSGEKERERKRESPWLSQHVRRVACHDLYAAIQANIYLLSSKTHLKCQHMRHISIATGYLSRPFPLSYSPTLSSIYKYIQLLRFTHLCLSCNKLW